MQVKLSSRVELRNNRACVVVIVAVETMLVSGSNYRAIESQINRLKYTYYSTMSLVFSEILGRKRLPKISVSTSDSGLACSATTLVKS